MNHLIRTTRRLIDADPRGMDDIAYTAGFSAHRVYRWSHTSPRVQNLEAVLEVLGYEIVLEKAASTITTNRRSAPCARHDP